MGSRGLVWSNIYGIDYFCSHGLSLEITFLQLSSWVPCSYLHQFSELSISLSVLLSKIFALPYQRQMARPSGLFYKICIETWKVSMCKTQMLCFESGMTSSKLVCPEEGSVKVDCFMGNCKWPAALGGGAWLKKDHWEGDLKSTCASLLFLLFDCCGVSSFPCFSILPLCFWSGVLWLWTIIGRQNNPVLL